MASCSKGDMEMEHNTDRDPVTGLGSERAAWSSVILPLAQRSIRYCCFRLMLLRAPSRDSVALAQFLRLAS